MKTILIIRAFLVAIASILLSIYIDNTAITILTLAIIGLGFMANIAVYKFIFKDDIYEEMDSYQSAHSM